MVKLNEYLGSIASSIAEARLASDLKSLEVAEQFAKHDLLKHFSVPRFKTANIELTIPVAIAAVSNGDTEPYTPIEDKNKFSEKTISILKKIVPTSVKPSPQGDLKLQSEVNKHITVLEKNLKSDADVSKEVQAYSEKAVQSFLLIYPATNIRINIPQVVNKVSEELKVYVQAKPAQGTTSPVPNVIVEAHKLRELPPENIIQIKMNLSEEGLEWHASENEDGKVTTKLLPE